VRTVGALRDFFIASGRGHRLIVGDGARIADLIEAWLQAGAADGFNICPPYLPGAWTCSSNSSSPNCSGVVSCDANMRAPPSASCWVCLARTERLPSVRDELRLR
jgi:hypothetical protein